jgi:hypothetical protein
MLRLRRAVPILSLFFLSPALELNAIEADLLPNGTPLPSITQSSSLSIVGSNSVNCTGVTGHLPHSFYRAFTLAEFNPPLDALLFHVEYVTVGIEAASSGDGLGQLVTLRLYDSSANPPTLASLGAPLANTFFRIADQGLTLVTLRVDAPPTLLNATDILVVELAVPDGTAALNSLVLGSNSQPESAPSYIWAPACGANEISTLAQFGWPGMHIVMSVSGFNDAAEASRIFSDGFECGATLNWDDL